jgi:hypothetical protein
MIFISPAILWSLPVTIACNFQLPPNCHNVGFRPQISYIWNFIEMLTSILLALVFFFYYRLLVITLNIYLIFFPLLFIVYFHLSYEKFKVKLWKFLYTNSLLILCVCSTFDVQSIKSDNSFFLHSFTEFRLNFSNIPKHWSEQKEPPERSNRFWSIRFKKRYSFSIRISNFLVSFCLLSLPLIFFVSFRFVSFFKPCFFLFRFSNFFVSFCFWILTFFFRFVSSRFYTRKENLKCMLKMKKLRACAIMMKELTMHKKGFLKSRVKVNASILRALKFHYAWRYNSVSFLIILLPFE